MVGCGEAAQAFASGWTVPAGTEIRAYDLKLNDPDAAGQIVEHCAATKEEPVGDIAAALKGAGVIFCLVTDDQALRAEAAAEHFNRSEERHGGKAGVSQCKYGGKA